MKETYGERVRVGELRLISPVLGGVTPPLQLYSWPDDALIDDDDYDVLDTWYSLDSDRSQPRPVVLRWERPIGLGNSAVFDVVVSADPELPESSRETYILRNLIDTQVELYNLRIGTPYYWKVTAHRNGHALSESALGHFLTHPAPPRWIRVPGITNVRDIGGWPIGGGRRIRQGMIYRGSEMNNHCQINGEGTQVMLEELGIRTDLDLRGIGEERKAVLDMARVEYVNIPVLAYDSIAHPEYTGRYRKLFGLLTERERYPFFIHCWGGADRTGTVAFLVQALLGASETDLFTDYELTSLSVWGERRRTSEAFQDLLKTLQLFGKRGRSIQAQVERYMFVIGVSDDEVQAIREILVE